MEVVIPTWSVGAARDGVATFLTKLVAALSRRDDVKLRLLCSPRSLPLFEGAAGADGVEIETFDVTTRSAARPLHEQWLARRIGTQHGDVLLVPSSVGFLRTSIPQIVVVQAPLAVPTIRAASTHLMRPDLLHRAYYRMAVGPTLRRADAVVAVSNWLRDGLLASFGGLQPERVHVVPEGVEVPSAMDPRPDATISRSPGDGDPARLLFVSVLHPYKGAHELIDALGHLASDRPELRWVCRIVGPDPSGGTTTDALVGHARRAGVADRVELLGSLDPPQVWDEYRRASVFVYPSRLETFGLPPLEAMAAGTPVVASDAASVGEVVSDGALLVDVTDTPKFAEAIAAAIGDQTVRDRLVSAGTRRARELSWDATAAAFTRLARHVAGEQR